METERQRERERDVGYHYSTIHSLKDFLSGSRFIINFSLKDRPEEKRKRIVSIGIGTK